MIDDSIDFSAYVRETEGREKVRPASEYIRHMAATLGQVVHEPKAYLPWPKTHGIVHLRPGEVSLWAGVNGEGKSLITGLVAMSLVSQGERVCVASFEMKPRATLGRMARQFAESSINGLEGDSDAIAAMRELYEQFGAFTDGKLWIYDQQGTVHTDTLIGVIRYCAKELRIQHMFIDSLMKCVRNEDDYNGQKAFVDEMTAIARDYGMHIHLVHHMRKLSSDEQQPDKADVKGSGSITDQVDNLFLLWRNRKKERAVQAGKTVAEGDPDVVLVVSKQRHGDWEGPIKLWVHRESMQLLESPGTVAMRMFNWPHMGPR